MGCDGVFEEIGDICGEKREDKRKQERNIYVEGERKRERERGGEEEEGAGGQEVFIGGGHGRRAGRDWARANRQDQRRM